MEIIAPNRDIIYSSATGQGKKEARSIRRAERKEASSTKRAERKEASSTKRAERKEVRSEKRAERKEKRELKGGGFLKRFFSKIKAKRDARKLRRATNKANQKVWVDEVPPVKDNVKTLPDNSTVTVPPQEQTKVGDITVDKKDLVGASNVTVENGTVKAEIPEDKVVITTNEETGEEEAYKESDIEKEGISTTGWLIIGGSAVVILGTIAYFATRKK